MTCMQRTGTVPLLCSGNSRIFCGNMVVILGCSVDSQRQKRGLEIGRVGNKTQRDVCDPVAICSAPIIQGQRGTLPPKLWLVWAAGGARSLPARDAATWHLPFHWRCGSLGLAFDRGFCHATKRCKSLRKRAFARMGGIVYHASPPYAPSSFLRCCTPASKILCCSRPLRVTFVIRQIRG